MSNNLIVQIPLDENKVSNYNNYEFNTIRIRGILADQKEDVALYIMDMLFGKINISLTTKVIIYVFEGLIEHSVNDINYRYTMGNIFVLKEKTDNTLMALEKTKILLLIFSKIRNE
jgi:hypothetical protein